MCPRSFNNRQIKKTTRARGEAEKRARSKVSHSHCNHRDTFKKDGPNILDCPDFVFALMKTPGKCPPPPNVTRMPAALDAIQDEDTTSRTKERCVQRGQARIADDGMRGKAGEGGGVAGCPVATGERQGGRSGRGSYLLFSAASAFCFLRTNHARGQLQRKTLGPCRYCRFECHLPPLLNGLPFGGGPEN